MTQNRSTTGTEATGEFDTVELRTGTTGATGSTSAGQGTGGVQQAVDRVQDKAGQVVDQARNSASRAVDQAQQAAAPAIDQAQQTAGQVVDQARQTVTSRVSSQKDRAATSLTTVAQAIRQTGDSLRQQDQAAVADYTDTAAQYVERFSNFLQGRDVGQLVGDVERYARRNPAMFLGSAFTLGLLGARFLKSSSQPDYQGGGDYRAPRTYALSPGYGNTAGTTRQFGTSTTPYGVGEETSRPTVGLGMRDDISTTGATGGSQFAVGADTTRTTSTTGTGASTTGAGSSSTTGTRNTSGTEGL